MKRVEGWVEIRDQGLGREGGQQRLSISPEVGRYLCALPDSDLPQKQNRGQSPNLHGVEVKASYVLHQTKNQYGQHLHIFAKR